LAAPLLLTNVILHNRINQIGRRLTEELVVSGEKKPKRQLLLMLDEFPALGRLDFFESSLAFMAGYGLRAFLISQSLNQIEKAYGPNNSILDNCQARQLITPGEIMQLPASQQLILLSGFSPIKAQKVRYFADKNFTGRVVAPPQISPDGYGGLSPNSPCVWGLQTRPVDDRLYGEDETAEDAKDVTEDEGSKDQKPDLDVSELMADTPENEVKDLELVDGDDLTTSLKLGEFVRGASQLARAHDITCNSEIDLGM